MSGNTDDGHERAQEPTLLITTCPRCAFDIPENVQGAPDCPGCGVIFARYDPDKALMARMQAVKEAEEPSRPPVILIGLLLAIALTLVVMLGVRQTMLGQLDDMEAAGPGADTAAALAEVSDPADLGEDAVLESPVQPAPGLTASQLLESGLDEYGGLDPNREKPNISEWQLGEIRRAMETEPSFEFGGEAEEPIPAGVPVVRAGEADALQDLQWIGWYEGAEGYTKALEQAHRMNRPLVIYFHTEWCNFCRAMNKDFLPDPLVRRFLSNVMRVHVNPELSADGEALARRFGVAGYPSFFVLPSGADATEATRVHPFRNGRAITPQEFAAECEEAANNS